MYKVTRIDLLFDRRILGIELRLYVSKAEENRKKNHNYAKMRQKRLKIAGEIKCKEGLENLTCIRHFEG